MDESRIPNRTSKSREHYVAVLVGCAVGDALGMPVEGWPKGRIQKYVGRITEPIAPVVIRDKDGRGRVIREDEFGKIEYFTRSLKRGEYTDDTILTLAIAESVAAVKGLDLEDIAQRHLEAYAANPDCGFGGTTRKAFAKLQEGISPFHSGVVGGPGNGPAMKMSPVGLYMGATGSYDYGLMLAGLVSRMTHLDPRSVASGIVQAHSVYALLHDLSRYEFLESAVHVSARCEISQISQEALSANFSAKFKLAELGSLTSRLRWVFSNRDAAPEKAFGVLGNSGLVVESYPFALFMFQRYWDNPVEGLLETVNYGGDCDTTGAMFGALSGARHGNYFPERFVEPMKGLDRLVAAAEKIYSLKEAADNQ